MFYSPVSGLPAESKIFERDIQKQIRNKIREYLHAGADPGYNLMDA